MNSNVILWKYKKRSWNKWQSSSQVVIRALNFLSKSPEIKTLGFYTHVKVRRPGGRRVCRNKLPQKVVSLPPGSMQNRSIRQKWQKSQDGIKVFGTRVSEMISDFYLFYLLPLLCDLFVYFPEKCRHSFSFIVDFVFLFKWVTKLNHAWRTHYYR